MGEDAAPAPRHAAGATPPPQPPPPSPPLSTNEARAAKPTSRRARSPPAAILELPRIGARNLRRRALASSSPLRTSASSPTPPDRLLLCLTRAPRVGRRRALLRDRWRRRLDASPYVLPVLRQTSSRRRRETPRGTARGETIRVAVYRRFIRHGSLRDALHRVTDPSQPHHAKYDGANAKPELLSRQLAARRIPSMEDPPPPPPPPTPTRAAASFGRRCHCRQLVAVRERCSRR